MSFNNRSEYINAQSSEKITLAHVDARQRILPWTLDSGTVYYKDVSNFVVSVHNELTQLTQVSSVGTIITNTWFYDTAAGRLYIDIGSDPADAEIIATYRLFYSSAPITTTYDLSGTGTHVEYEARIQRSPGFKHKVGVEQRLVSIIGNGSLKLINNDGGLDDIFDTLIFDNQSVSIYSWNRDLPITDSRILYRGRITNKRYNSEFVTFEVKDELVDLKANVDLSVFGETENVNNSVKNNYKRRVYGRVDGLQLQSVDQIAEGYTLTGTFTGAPGSKTIDVDSGDILNELSPDDKLIIGTQEFTVDVVSPTGLNGLEVVVTSEPDFAFTNQTATAVPEIPVRFKNREFFVADHESARVTKTLQDIVQLNRVQLNDIDGLFAGDFIEFSTGERIEIKNFAPNNVVVLRKNIIQVPAISSNVIRRPIQELFIQGTRVEDADYTISNSTDTRVTIDTDAEFNIAGLEQFSISMTFTNTSKTITTTDDVDLREVFSPRDWIRPQNITYTTYYEILAVAEQSITIRTGFGDPTITDNIEAKRPDYIGDNTIVSANVLGKTKDGTAAGEWISDGPTAIRDLLLDAGLTEINETSFTEGSSTNDQIISMALPLTPGATSVTYKSAIDRLAGSINSVVTLDNDLKIKFKVLNAEMPDSPVEITDYDVISWDMETISGKNIRNSIISYRPQDIIRSTQEKGAEVVTFSSEFVEKYIGTNNTEEKTVHLYDDTDAEIFAHRLVYNQSLGRTDVTINTDLRLEDVEIGDVVIIDFARMFKRFGDSTSRKKACIVIGKKLDGSRTQLDLTDYGNILNRSSIITPNDAPDWTSATEDEKLKYGYITDQQGIVNNEEDTANIHLIS